MAVSANMRCAAADYQIQNKRKTGTPGEDRAVCAGRWRIWRFTAFVPLCRAIDCQR